MSPAVGGPRRGWGPAHALQLIGRPAARVSEVVEEDQSAWHQDPGRQLDRFEGGDIEVRIGVDEAQRAVEHRKDVGEDARVHSDVQC